MNGQKTSSTCLTGRRNCMSERHVALSATSYSLSTAHRELTAPNVARAQSAAVHITLTRTTHSVIHARQAQSNVQQATRRDANTLCCKGSGVSDRQSATNTYAIDEGDVQVNPGAFQIPYDVLLPKRSESENLLVPGAVSSSHVGFSCLRLEPQWMIMGHSAGTAAAMAVSQGDGNVYNVDREKLHAQLQVEGQILTPKILRNHLLKNFLRDDNS